MSLVITSSYLGHTHDHIKGFASTILCFDAGGSIVILEHLMGNWKV